MEIKHLGYQGCANHLVYKTLELRYNFNLNGLTNGDNTNGDLLLIKSNWLDSENTYTTMWI